MQELNEIVKQEHMQIDTQNLEIEKLKIMEAYKERNTFEHFLAWWPM